MSSPFTDLPGSNGGGAGCRRPERFARFRGGRAVLPFRDWLGAPRRQAYSLLCRPLLRPRLLPELLLDRLGHEVLHGDLVRHAVKLQAAVKLLRDAGRQLRPGFIRPGHLCRLPLRSRWTTGTTTAPVSDCEGTTRRVSRAHE